MTTKKRIGVMLFFPVIILLVFLFFLRWPVKKAINIDSLDKDTCYIVKPVEVTRYIWEMVDADTGDKISNVIIWGNDPDAILKPSLFVDSDNTFVIYGDVSEKYVDEDGAPFLILYSRNFDIVGPIQRSDLFFSSSQQLTPSDYLWFNR